MQNRHTFFYSEKDLGFLEYSLKCLMEMQQYSVAILVDYADTIKAHRVQGTLDQLSSKYKADYDSVKESVAQGQMQIEALEKIINQQPITKEAQQSLLEIKAFRGTVIERYENISDRDHHSHGNRKRCVTL